MGELDGQARRVGWVDALVVVAVVAVGVIVAGLLHDPGASSSAEDEASPVSRVTPTVVYPVEIPGCERVEPPSGGKGFMVGYAGEQSYDNPSYPWFNGPKATAMSDALRSALPDTVRLEFAGPSESLWFQPIPVFTSELPEGVRAEDIGGSTSAQGLLTRGAAAGMLDVRVRQSTPEIPECVAGQLDRRTTFPDGTVVDSRDTWNEYGGNRNLVRRVTAHLPDGTFVDASAGDENWAEPVQARRNSGTVPLTVDELTALATTPGLRVTAPVPAGTAQPPAECRAGVDAGTPLSRETVQRLNAALDEVWREHAPTGVSLDRRLGSLQLSTYNRSSVCEELGVSGPDGSGRLLVSISGRHQLPVEPQEPSDRRRTTFTALPDGSVLTRTEPGIVTVTRPSGTRVQVSLDDAAPGTVLTLDQLQEIATAPGLEL